MLIYVLGNNKSSFDIKWTDKRGLRLKMIELIIAIMKESNYLCLSDKIQELWVPYDHNSGLYNTFYRYRIGSAQYKLTIRGSQEDKLIIKSIQDYFSETELDFLIAAERQGTFYKVSLKWSETWEVLHIYEMQDISHRNNC